MSLFKLGEFTSAAGLKLPFKIECDALDDDDWKCLAWLASQMAPAFGSVIGVPSGGIPFANAMQQYVTEGPPLLVDDVWTTGTSMRKLREQHPEANGCVVFVRSEWIDFWCVPLIYVRQPVTELKLIM